MSRAQQNAIESTETGNAATSTTAANTSESAEQADINSGQSQLAKFAANNPYVQGGQADTVEGQQIAGAADATAAGAMAKNQQQTQRTGQNATAGVAAGESEAQQAQRTAGTEEAAATQSRLASGTQYAGDVLKAGNTLTSEQGGLTSQELSEAQGEENIGEEAAKTPSLGDEFGDSFISGLGSGLASGVTSGFGKG
jgi:hypothetical protein